MRSSRSARRRPRSRTPTSTSAGSSRRRVPAPLLVDLSASTPSFARELNAVAVVSDLVFVEAPLVVGDMMAADAFSRRENLTCFAAGEKGDVERAWPLLEVLVGAVHETGGSGSAQLARAAYTLQTAAQVVSAIEADALYRAVMGSTAGPQPGGEARGGRVSAGGARACRHQ